MYQAAQYDPFTFVNPFTVPLRQESPEVYELLKEPRRKKDENVALSRKQHKAETDRIRNENTQREAQHQQKLKERQQKKAEEERAKLLSLRKPPAPFVQKTPEQMQLEMEAMNKRNKEDAERRRKEFLEEEKLKAEELAAIKEIFLRETAIVDTNLQGQLKKINDEYTAIEKQIDEQYKAKQEMEKQGKDRLEQERLAKEKQQADQSQSSEVEDLKRKMEAMQLELSRLSQTRAPAACEFDSTIVSRGARDGVIGGGLGGLVAAGPKGAVLGAIGGGVANTVVSINQAGEQFKECVDKKVNADIQKTMEFLQSDVSNTETNKTNARKQ